MRPSLGGYDAADAVTFCFLTQALIGPVQIFAERGTTILLTTHDLGDIERLCRRVMIIDRGRPAYDGGLDELRRTVDADRLLVVEPARPGPPIRVAGIEAERVEGPRQWLRLPGAVNAAAAVAEPARDHEIRDISLREAGIEEVLGGLYRGEHAYRPRPGGSRPVPERARVSPRAVPGEGTGGGRGQSPFLDVRRSTEV